jgi:hypothetical protein
MGKKTRAAWATYRKLHTPTHNKRHIVLSIPKKDVAVCDFSSIADLVSDLTLQGQLVIVFDGYDDDVREIWEIPETRHYLASLVRQYPLTPFLLSTMKPFQTLDLLLLSLSPIDPNWQSVACQNSASASHQQIMEWGIKAGEYIIDHGGNALEIEKIGAAMRDMAKHWFFPDTEQPPMLASDAVTTVATDDHQPK